MSLQLNLHCVNVITKNHTDIPELSCPFKQNLVCWNPGTDCTEFGRSHVSYKPEDVHDSALALRTSSFADLLAQSQGTAEHRESLFSDQLYSRVGGRMFG